MLFYLYQQIVILEYKLMKNYFIILKFNDYFNINGLNLFKTLEIKFFKNCFLNSYIAKLMGFVVKIKYKIKWINYFIQYKLFLMHACNVTK